MPGRDHLEIKEHLLKRFFPRVERLPEYLKGILPEFAREHVEKIFQYDDRDSSNPLAAALIRLRAAYICTGASLEAQDEERWSDWQIPDSTQEALQEGGLSALVELAQARLLRAGAGTRQPSNMLTLGYREADDRMAGLREARMMGSLAVTNFYVNPLVSMIVLGREWQHLWEQLGSAVMLYLFTHTSLFVPMCEELDGDHNLMQVLGPNLSEIQPVDAAEAKEQIMQKSSRRKRKRSAVADEVQRTQPAMPKSRKKTLENRSKSDSALVIRERVREPVHVKASKSLRRSTPARKASDIVILRNRIYYARPIKSRKGRVALGLPIMHIFNRTTPKAVLAKRARRMSSCLAGSTRDGCCRVEKSVREERARKVVKYVWPREFGLHNVFTSSTSRSKTTERLQEYTNREEAIRARGAVRTPKRLQTATRLIAIMLSKHDRVDYAKCLHYCCPSSLRSSRLTRAEKEQIVLNLSETPYEAESVLPVDIQLQTQPGSVHAECYPASQRCASQVHLAPAKPAFTKYKVATGSVSRFAQAIMRQVVPPELLGSHHNMRILLKNIDTFVRQRRHESMSLHQLCQGMRVLDCDWLLPRNKRSLFQRPTAEEMRKRQSLLSELVYYLFDSVLIPLLRTNFYATESVAFRNRTIYFRQDDWNTITMPLLEKLKTSCFTALNKNEAIGIMSGRDFGYSYIRLLPKLNGVRPIVNLRRRSVKIDRNRSDAQQVVQQQQQSINNILNITFQVLNYEKRSNWGRLGSSVFGAQDIYESLHRYRSELLESNGGILPRLYFVKVDVACAFDSIDQEKLLTIVQDIISHDRYVIQKFCQIMLKGDRVSKTWPRVACPEDEVDSTFSAMQTQSKEVNNVLLCDGLVYSHCERSKLIWLLEEHINNNLIKVGKEFCKQRIGIPQGSSLSTLLCCYYLAKMEEEKGFCRSSAKGDRDKESSSSLLMRYTDDFLFISTSQSKARHFYETMKEGDRKYNMRISPDKSLHNLEVGVTDEFSRLANDVDLFPWCSYLINLRTLSVEYDLARYRHTRLSDTLTIHNKQPIQTLGKVIQSSIRNQGLGIFLDVEYNGIAVVLGNLYRNFLLTALKFLSCFREIQRGRHGFVIAAAGTTSMSPTKTSISMDSVKYLVDCIMTSIDSCYTGVRCKVNKSKAAVTATRSPQSQNGEGPTGEEERWSIDRHLFQLVGMHAFARILSQRPSSRKWSALLHDRMEARPRYQLAALQAHSNHIDAAWKSSRGIIASISI